MTVRDYTMKPFSLYFLLFLVPPLSAGTIAFVTCVHRELKQAGMQPSPNETLENGKWQDVDGGQSGSPERRRLTIGFDNRDGIDSPGDDEP